MAMLRISYHYDLSYEEYKGSITPIFKSLIYHT